MDFRPPTFPEQFNLAEYYLSARIAEGRGERTAIIAGQRRLSYLDVEYMANGAAFMLRHWGVEYEDRVLLALPDSPEFAAAFFGVLKCGAVVTMVNTELPSDDYAYYLEYTRARVLVTTDALAQRIRAHTDSALKRHLHHVWTVDGGIEPAEAFESAQTHRDDPAIWLFTSGSTGKPKAAVHFHHDFAYNTECYGKRVLELREDDVTLSVPKLYFGYATGTNLMFPFAVGAATVLFPDKATPERIFELIERHRPTVLTSVPTMINKMVSAPDAKQRNLSSLRVCISAGEALAPELYQRWKDSFGVEILDGIGSAELFHIYISNRFGDVRPGSLGQLVPGYEARIVADDGSEVPTGEIGTLWVKGDSAALCYWESHERSKEVLRGDWVSTGDKFRRDEAGYFYYAGRADDLLKVDGIWVSPIEVENVLLQHAAVLECCVVGYEDESKLTKAKAYVVRKPGAEVSAEALREFVRERLAHYKVPRRIEFVAALPRSDRGKVLRRELKS
ncbi:MAG TPA: benzoate-CoA ligase family protein [Polyangia bacterium]|nr:benzoate-CoA ligase family protein [Polyangia bacterium]